MMARRYKDVDEQFALAIVVVWSIFAVVGVALSLAIIWGIVQVVQAVTS